MTQHSRETGTASRAIDQRCARRRATLRSNAHVDAIARDLDVMASATAIFFSPASSMALLGAALAPEDVHLFEVRFAASFLRSVDSVLWSGERWPTPAYTPSTRSHVVAYPRRCGATRRAAGAWAPRATG